MEYVILLVILGLLAWFIVLLVQEIKREQAKTPEEKAYDAAVREHERRVHEAEKLYNKALKAHDRRVAAARWQHEKAQKMGDGYVDSIIGKEGKIEVHKLYITTPQGRYPLDPSVRAEVDTAGAIAVKSRTTLTRVATGAVLFGPIGALIGASAKKNTVIDTRQLFLVIESDAFAAALTLSPDQASQAHAFATKLLQTAKQVPVLKADQKRMLEETQKNIEEEQADRREINTASHNLTLVQKDTQTVDAAKRAADAAIARKTGAVAQQHKR
ncbi:MAG TPA: hypothetical protein K8U78_05930 [Aeriscardovia aeriphila]|uniref:Uncharacterized protein n=1 Tax=Aeriscardovia aeriphila TaxID=218139 RepID=A0A921FW22_9BIFI|nr:hypothetical protein [Aeriscardovia aeriphila]